MTIAPWQCDAGALAELVAALAVPTPAITISTTAAARTAAYRFTLQNMVVLLSCRA
jgi:hypothetical protein